MGVTEAGDMTAIEAGAVLDQDSCDQRLELSDAGDPRRRGSEFDGEEEVDADEARDDEDEPLD